MLIITKRNLMLMNRFSTKLTLLAVCLSFFNSSFSQLGVTAQVGGLKFLGDVGKKNSNGFLNGIKGSVALGAEYRIGKVLGVGVEGMYGKLSGSDNDKNAPRLNFESKIMGGGLNVFAFFDKLGQEQKDASPYIHAGVGYLMFDPYGDLKNKNNISYNYWSDGSIRDMVESADTKTLSMVIKRDYTYESQLKDSTVTYARNTIFFPVGIGATFKMGDHANFRIGAIYNVCLTDYLDNHKEGGNDSWASLNVGINFHFAKKEKDEYSDVDFAAIDNADSDGDGVKDLDDKCMGTPSGVKVDATGCPEDNDGDGVFDYMDKELKTAKDAKVDANGVTINEEEVAKQQLEWMTSSAKRREKIVVEPPVQEQQAAPTPEQAAPVIMKKTSSLPAQFASIDYNSDGFISSDEIKMTLDDFSKGESSFKQADLNKLIDFFFEQ